MPTRKESTEFEEAEPRHRGPWLLIIVVIVAIAIAIWQVPDDTLPTEAPPEENAGQPGDVQRSAAPPLTPAPAPLPAAQPAPSEGEIARTLISEHRSSNSGEDLDTLFVEAERLQTQGNETDAYLLLFYLAREGHGPAALQLAEAADPVVAGSRVELLEQADAVQAIKWYRIASAAGIGEADSRLAALKRYLEQQAANGDLKAQRQLLQW